MVVSRPLSAYKKKTPLLYLRLEYKEADMTGDIKTKSIVTGRTPEFSSINRTIVIDFSGSAFGNRGYYPSCNPEVFSFTKHLKTLRLANQGVGCIL